MKVFAVSDLHLSINNPKPMDIFGPVWDDYLDKITGSWRQNVTADDVVLIAGDISWAMNLENAIADLDFIGSLPGKKVMVRGNHDYWWKSISGVRAKLPADFYALQNDFLRLGDMLFCGSRGWGIECETTEDKKIFDRELIRLELSLAAMQKNRHEGDKVAVLIHFPPFNFRLENSPVTELFAAYKINKVVYGHLHGKAVRCVPRLNKDGVEYILTSCDQIGNRLVEIF